MYAASYLQERFGSRYPAGLVTVDSHTQGEATRLLLHGAGDIPGQTMAEKRRHFMERLDHIRTLLCHEPRGHHDLLAAAVTAPASKKAHFGLIYMDARRYPYLCGHATIGAVTTLLELGLLFSPQSRALPLPVVVDTPSGLLHTTAQLDGDRVASVAMTSMPAFVYKENEPLEIPGLGKLMVDTVCAGGFFVMVDADASGLDISPQSYDRLVPLGMQIIEEANRQLTVRHPERPEVTTVDVVEFYRELEPGRGESRVVYGESHLDRSPCGTGTTAKAALYHCRGKLPLGREYENIGSMQTSFGARIVEETTVGDLPAVCVEITGSAVMTGCHTFIQDPHDPFPQGFLP